MQYVLTFLEGIITFISPCLLPMLPIYILYFAGENGVKKKGKTMANAFGFVLGFTLMFALLGLFAGLLGGFLIRYKTTVNIITGAIVILFGLNYIGVIKIKLINSNHQFKNGLGKMSNFFSAIVFGAVFSVSWTPCAGAFLGSALMKAANNGSTVQGVLLLLCYSIGLGLPFLLSALFIEHVKNAFVFIKKHYKIINIASGVFLVAVGFMMAIGQIDKILAMLTT